MNSRSASPCPLCKYVFLPPCLDLLLSLSALNVDAPWSMSIWLIVTPATSASLGSTSITLPTSFVHSFCIFPKPTSLLLLAFLLCPLALVYFSILGPDFLFADFPLYSLRKLYHQDSVHKLDRVPRGEGRHILYCFPFPDTGSQIQV